MINYVCVCVFILEINFQYIPTGIKCKSIHYGDNILNFVTDRMTYISINGLKFKPIDGPPDIWNSEYSNRNKIVKFINVFLYKKTELIYLKKEFN